MPRVSLVGMSLVLTLGACGADATDTAAAPTTTSTLSALPAAGASSEAPPGAGAVAIAQFAFLPSPVTVAPGGTVTWTNNDEAAHTVRDARPMGTPESKSLNKGDTFSISYPQPGTYQYVCGIHNYMQGSVEVKG